MAGATTLLANMEISTWPQRWYETLLTILTIVVSEAHRRAVLTGRLRRIYEIPNNARRIAISQEHPTHSVTFGK